MRYRELTSMLQQALGLDLPPVALALVDEQPAGVPQLEEAVPSACSFWRRAERQVFYADAEAHFNCPIGAMVMGFELSEPKRQELMGLVEQMCAISYIRPEEVHHIPTFGRAARGIVYGPLSEFPQEPDVVVLWTTPAQAMLLEEAVGATLWSESPQAAVFGRPACGVLPTSLVQGKPSLSLGCMGMRTYTEIAPDRLLISIPGSTLSELGNRLEQTVSANQQMRDFYAGQKERFQSSVSSPQS